MATETEFVTAPSTPEPGPAEQPPDTLEIVVEQRLRQQQHQHDGGGGSSSSTTMTIFRVPAHVRDANAELYEPRLVSIGPYYRGRAALRGMEQHKWRCLHELLAHYPKASLSACVGAVRAVEHRARRCYSERTEIFDKDDEFAEMLLLDGCFVLQFFTKWYTGEPDALSDVGWGLPLLLSDLLLLENQVPLFVLEALFRAVNPEASRLGLLMLVVPRFKFNLDGGSAAFCEQVLAGAVPAQAQSEIHHLLHLLYVAFVPRAEDLRQMGLRSRSTAAAPMAAVPSVTQLREAGVRFEEASPPRARHVFDVTFDAARGVLRMPRLTVDYATKAQLVNLIAFEQTTATAGDKPVSSYAALVGSLVRAGGDVEHLQKRGVVDNLLGADGDAAKEFFQKLGDCGSLDYYGGGGDHVFAAVFDDLNRYYRSSCQRHKAQLVRDYCSSPWAVLALVVAGCAFCFALFKFSTTIYGLAHPYCHC
ncbi:unnamed protein product [Urochloa humidicola]